MSTRYEWFNAADVAVDYVRPGETVDGSDPVIGPFPDELVAERGAIVISGDECTVLHGSPTDLRTLAERILAAIPEDAPDEVEETGWFCEKCDQPLQDPTKDPHGAWTDLAGGVDCPESEDGKDQSHAGEPVEDDDEVERALDESADMYFGNLED